MPCHTIAITSQLRSKGCDDGGEKFPKRDEHLGLCGWHGQQEPQGAAEGGVDAVAEHRTTRVSDDCKSVQSPGLNNWRGGVLCKSEKDRHTGCQVLARAQGTDISVKAAECK